MKRLSIKQAKRNFIARVRWGVNDKGCWELRSAYLRVIKKPAQRYISVNTGRGKNTGAHRYAWELANGRPVPQGMHVLHSCDYSLCVNPAHLRLGTQKENNVDAIERKLVMKKISDDELWRWRCLWKRNDYTRKQIAAMMGVHESYTYRILPKKQRARP